jgi:RND family efflux transporter MFP subunit
MKKIIALILIGGFLFSCGSGVKDEKAIRAEIKEYQAQIAELDKKIKDLEGQLPEGNNNHNNTGNALKVRTVKVVPKPFSKYFTATGELEAISEAFISPEVSGQITSINVKEGQKVKRGQLLAKLNTSLIEKNIEEVKTQLELAETFYNKQTELWNKGIGSERQYLETKNNYENLKNMLATLEEQYNMSIIKSPINGYVENIMLKQGELASPGMQLMQIVDLDNLYVTAKLSEAHLPVIKAGEKVTITFPSFPELVLERPVTRIGNVINRQNRTFLVEIKISNKDGRLKPNLLANIKINDYNSASSIVVPSMVIREDLVGSYLYVAEKDEDSNMISRKKYINVGRAYQGTTEVLSGLKENEQVITDGYGNVSDGAFIEVVS